jgi:hypothetical protein
VLLQPDVHVDPVGPQVHVVRAGQVPVSERALLSLPGLGQTGDHRRPQARRRAEELAERGHEVAGRQAVQVQQRQHLGDLRGLAHPRRQDRRGKPLPLPGHRIGPLVVHPQDSHLHRAGAGQHLPALVVAVTGFKHCSLTYDKAAVAPSNCAAQSAGRVRRALPSGLSARHRRSRRPMRHQCILSDLSLAAGFELATAPTQRDGNAFARATPGRPSAAFGRT